ncbi:hypothetical protein ACVWZZ_005964 [Bradyrhizobium sp. LM6.10]
MRRDVAVGRHAAYSQNSGSGQVRQQALNLHNHQLSRLGVALRFYDIDVTGPPLLFIVSRF